MDIKHLPEEPDVTAPDGSDVRVLLQLSGGSMAHFELAPGAVSRAVAHRTVDEIWYFISGRGQMWRKDGSSERVDDVEPGICITIPCGTGFQFRTAGDEPLAAVGVTMPPWPGMDEAFDVDGYWTVPGG